MHSIVDDVQKDIYVENPKGISDDERRKMAFEMIKLSRKDNMSNKLLKARAQINHNPSLIFDEEGRLRRW